MSSSPGAPKLEHFARGLRCVFRARGHSFDGGRSVIVMTWNVRSSPLSPLGVTVAHGRSLGGGSDPAHGGLGGKPSLLGGGAAAGGTVGGAVASYDNSLAR